MQGLQSQQDLGEQVQDVLFREVTQLSEKELLQVLLGDLRVNDHFGSGVGLFVDEAVQEGKEEVAFDAQLEGEHAFDQVQAVEREREYLRGCHLAV